MSDITVKAYTGLQGTPAVQLALLCAVEINEKGFGDGTIGPAWDQNAFVGFAMNGREQIAVGVLTWRHFEHTKEVFVCTGYVLPEFRGRGVYTAMWHELIAKAMELKAGKITSGIHIRNEAMRRISAKFGRTEEFVMVRFDLPQD